MSKLETYYDQLWYIIKNGDRYYYEWNKDEFGCIPEDFGLDIHELEKDYSYAFDKVWEYKDQWLILSIKLEYGGGGSYETHDGPDFYDPTTDVDEFIVTKLVGNNKLERLLDRLENGKKLSRKQKKFWNLLKYKRMTEDEYDIQVCDAIVSRIKTGKEKTYSLEEAKEILGL